MSVIISVLQTFSLQKTSHGSSHDAGMCLTATSFPRSNISELLELLGQLGDVGMEKGSSISLFVRAVLEQLQEHVTGLSKQALVVLFLLALQRPHKTRYRSPASDSGQKSNNYW